MWLFAEFFALLGAGTVIGFGYWVFISRDFERETNVLTRVSKGTMHRFAIWSVRVGAVFLILAIILGVMAFFL